MRGSVCVPKSSSSMNRATAEEMWARTLECPVEQILNQCVVDLSFETLYRTVYQITVLGQGRTLHELFCQKLQTHFVAYMSARLRQHTRASAPPPTAPAPLSSASSSSSLSSSSSSPPPPPLAPPSMQQRLASVVDLLEALAAEAPAAIDQPARMLGDAFIYMDRVYSTSSNLPTTTDLVKLYYIQAALVTVLQPSLVDLARTTTAPGSNPDDPSLLERHVWAHLCAMANGRPPPLNSALEATATLALGSGGRGGCGEEGRCGLDGGGCGGVASATGAGGDPAYTHTHTHTYLSTVGEYAVADSESPSIRQLLAHASAHTRTHVMRTPGRTHTRTHAHTHNALTAPQRHTSSYIFSSSADEGWGWYAGVCERKRGPCGGKRAVRSKSYHHHDHHDHHRHRRQAGTQADGGGVVGAHSDDTSCLKQSVAQRSVSHSDWCDDGDDDIDVDDLSLELSARDGGGAISSSSSDGKGRTGGSSSSSSGGGGGVGVIEGGGGHQRRKPTAVAKAVKAMARSAAETGLEVCKIVDHASAQTAPLRTSALELSAWSKYCDAAVDIMQQCLDLCDNKEGAHAAQRTTPSPPSGLASTHAAHTRTPHTHTHTAKTSPVRSVKVARRSIGSVSGCSGGGSDSGSGSCGGGGGGGGTRGAVVWVDVGSHSARPAPSAPSTITTTHPLTDPRTDTALTIRPDVFVPRGESERKSERENE